MEFVPNTLEDLHTDPTLDVCAVTTHISSALVHIHAHNIRHGDLKPENILMANTEDHWVAKLADFGESEYIRTYSVDYAGTPFFMAPELLQQPRRCDDRADMFSLGMILIKLLTDPDAWALRTSEYARHFPWTFPTQKQLMREVIIPLVEEVGQDFLPLLYGLLARKPSNRWRASKALWWLTKINGGQDSGQTSDAGRCRDSGRKRKRGLHATTAAGRSSSADSNTSTVRLVRRSDAPSPSTRQSKSQESGTSGSDITTVPISEADSQPRPLKKRRDADGVSCTTDSFTTAKEFQSTSSFTTAKDFQSETASSAGLDPAEPQDADEVWLGIDENPHIADHPASEIPSSILDLGDASARGSFMLQQHQQQRSPIGSSPRGSISSIDSSSDGTNFPPSSTTSVESLDFDSVSESTESFSNGTYLPLSSENTIDSLEYDSVSISTDPLSNESYLPPSDDQGRRPAPNNTAAPGDDSVTTGSEAESSMPDTLSWDNRGFGSELEDGPAIVNTAVPGPSHNSTAPHINDTTTNSEAETSMPDTLPWDRRGLGCELEERLVPDLLAPPGNPRAHGPTPASPVPSSVATPFPEDDDFGEGRALNMDEEVGGGEENNEDFPYNTSDWCESEGDEIEGEGEGEGRAW